MGDKIIDLPVNRDRVNNDDLEIVSALFQNKNTAIVGNTLKESLLVIILFALFVSQSWEKILRTFGLHNELYLWAAKVVIFIVVFFLLKGRI